MNPRLKSILAKTAVAAVVYVGVLLLVQVGIIDAYLQATMVTICVNIILAVSLNLVTGFTGQFSLGHAGFMAIGAYSTALITMSMPTVLGFILGLLVGAILVLVGRNRAKHVQGPERSIAALEATKSTLRG